MTVRLLVPFVVIALLASGSRAEAPATPPATAPIVFDVAADRSTLAYKVVHQLHTVEGISNKVQGRAAVLPDGTVQVMLRAAVNTFESGNSNRDVHMQETVEAPKFPVVSFKGVAKTGRDVVHTAGPQKIELVGDLEFHGEKRRESIPVEVTFTNEKEAHVTGAIAISLDGYKVERPSLLLVKIEDECRISFDLTVARSGG